MDMTERVNALISNEKSDWVEEDRKILTTMSEDQIAKVEKGLVVEPDVDAGDGKGVQNDADDGKDTDDEDGGDGDEKPQTVNEYLDKAPDGVKDVLAEGVAIRDAQHSQLVKELKENKRCKISEDRLKTMSLAELKELAQLGNIPVSFKGRETVDDDSPTDNDGDGTPDMPDMDFSKK